MAASAPMWTSKLGSKYPKDEIERLDSEHHRLLQRLRKEPRNARCAECGEGDTSWASVSLGVFLCVRCSDVHRAVGTHISKVKGCSGTYLWGPDEIARMQEVGNANAEALYGSDAPKPAPSASKEERVELCRRKYEQRHCAKSSSAVKAVRPTPPPSAPVPKPEAPPPTVAVLPTPTRAPVMEQPSARKPVDLLDFDAFFADFDGAGPGADSPAGSQQRHQGRPEPASETGAPSPPATGDTGLDAFLSQCLDGTALSPSPPPARPEPSAARLQRPEEPSLWDNFGAW